MAILDHGGMELTTVTQIIRLKDLWMREAIADNVLPLNDLSIGAKDIDQLIKLLYKVPVPPTGRYTYYPGTSPIPGASAANTHAVSYKILADVIVEPGAQGVIFAHGSRFGGHALYVKDGNVRYVYNFLGIPPLQVLEAPLPAARRHLIGVDFAKERVGETHETLGTATLYIDDAAIVSQPIRTIGTMFSLSGEGLCIGYDSADPVSTDYSGRFDFTGGQIVQVVFDVADDAYIDIERQLAAATARD
jgi:hypothetical protein